MTEAIIPRNTERQDLRRCLTRQRTARPSLNCPLRRCPGQSLGKIRHKIYSTCGTLTKFTVKLLFGAPQNGAVQLDEMAYYP